MWTVDVRLCTCIQTSADFWLFNCHQKSVPFGGVRACMFTHNYRTNKLRKIKWPSAVMRLTAHFTCGLVSDLMLKAYDLHDAEWPHWDQASFKHWTHESVSIPLYLSFYFSASNPSECCNYSEPVGWTGRIAAICAGRKPQWCAQSGES